MGYKFVDGQMTLCVLLMALLVGCTYNPIAPPLDEQERVDWSPMMYESVMAGDVLICPYSDCVVLARFGVGQPLTVTGMIGGGDGDLWYIIAVGDGVEGYVPIEVMVYSFQLNTTPTPDGAMRY